MPKVSVIIRTYNRADLIERALASVFNQTFQDFEIVVADDGSTDHTRQIVANLAAKDPRIKFVSQTHFGTPGRTFNLGLNNSHGQYVAILDSDDEWLPTKLEKQIKLLENTGPKTGLVTCHALLISPDSPEQERKASAYQSCLESALARKIPFSLSSVLIKKEIFDYLGSIDENYRIADDWDMYIRITQKYNYDFVDEVLLKYYKHDSNISFTPDYFRHAADLEYLLQKHLELYKKYPKILEHWYFTLASYLKRSNQKAKSRTYTKKGWQLNPSWRNLIKLALAYLQ